VPGQGRVEIIDLEKDRVAFGFEGAKVVLFVRVVLMKKIVVDCDGLHDSCNCLIAEGGDPNRDDCCFYASPEVRRSRSLRICSIFDVIIVRS